MRRYASVSLFLAVALLSLTAFPASANNVVPPLGEPPLFRANNNNHWFAYAPTSGPEIVGGFEATRTQSYEPTDLVTSNRGTGVGDSIDWDVYSEKCYGCHPAPRSLSRHVERPQPAPASTAAGTGTSFMTVIKPMDWVRPGSSSSSPATRPVTPWG